MRIAAEVKVRELSKPSYPSYVVLMTAEARNGPWWEALEQAKAYCAQHKSWPQRNHPTLGKWVSKVNSALQKRREGCENWQGRGDYALTADRYLALQACRYQPNTRGKSQPKQGSLGKVFAKLEAGQPLDKKDMSFLKRVYRQGQLSDKSCAMLEAYGVSVSV